jgi:hypothetical protein
MVLDCKERNDCIHVPLCQYRSWIIHKQKHCDISGTYVYVCMYVCMYVLCVYVCIIVYVCMYVCMYTSDQSFTRQTTVQTTACFVHVTLTVVTCHGPAGNIQYKPTPALHCVLCSKHPDQGSRCVKVRRSSHSVTLAARQMASPKTHFKIQPPCW